MQTGMKNFWVLAPTPDQTYEITLAYDKEPATITDTTLLAQRQLGTYLSNKYQDLLLYACLVNAYGYLKRSRYVTILSKPI